MEEASSSGQKEYSLFDVVHTCKKGNARAGILQGVLQTPALACYTEHGGALPFLTRDLLLEIKERHPASFGLLVVDLKSCLPVKEGTDPSSGLNLEQRLCLPPGLITCLSIRDCLGNQSTSCGPSIMHLDTANGRRFLGATDHYDEVMKLAPSLATAVFDEVPAGDGASKTRHIKAVERSLVWLDKLLLQLKGGGGGEGKPKPAILAGIVGGLDLELRQKSTKETVKREGLEGVVIGGLGLGETQEERGKIVETVIKELPIRLIRMMIGASSPSNVLEAMEAGVDLISSACPYLLARSGHALVFSLKEQTEQEEEGEQKGEAEADEGPSKKRPRLGEPEDDRKSHVVESSSSSAVKEDENMGGVMHLWDRRWRRDQRPLVEGCGCLACWRHSRAYIHHLLLAHEMLAEVLLYVHNLEHFLKFFEISRGHLIAGRLSDYKRHIVNVCGLP